MPIWIFRISTLFAFPFLLWNVWTICPAEWDRVIALATGLLCGIIVVVGEAFFKRMRLIKLMIACTGVVLGLILYTLISYCMEYFGGGYGDWLRYRDYVRVFLMAFGLIAALRKSRELEGLSYKGHHLKVVDLSSLIDGRIVDLCQINFLSGILVLPAFVTDAINDMLNGRDKTEQAKAKRAKEVIARLQKNKEIEVRFTSKNPKGKDLDEKIVKLAKSLDAEVVTLNFEINKIATLHKVIVLNIADLATALKPVVLPGETMSLFVMKDGKEKEQGIGYLDDGTMVVVENGRKSIGKRVEVSVYSIYQTPSGRMIFANIK